MKEISKLTMILSCFIFVKLVTGQSEQCRRYSLKEPLRDLEIMLDWLQQEQVKCKAPETNCNVEKNQVTKNKLTTTEINSLQDECQNTNIQDVDKETENINGNTCSYSKTLDILGKFILACGRRYFIGNTTMTADEASTVCCSLNMKLVAIDTVDNLFCLSRFLTHILDLQKIHTFWTSGRKVNNKFTWKSKSDEDINENVWVLNFDAMNKNPPCVSAMLSTDMISFSGIQASLCTEKYYALCQAEDKRAPSTNPPTTENPNCETPTCPKSDCQNLENNIELSSDNFIDMGNNCNNKKYVLSTSKFTFNAAQTVCCQINFKNVVIRSSKESACLRDLLVKVSNSSKTIFSWTSGTSQDCKKKWIWCSTGQSVSSKANIWAVVQPDNKHDHERCIQFGKIGPTYGIFDVDCDVLLPVLCEQDL